MPETNLKIIHATTAQVLSHPTWDLMLVFVILAIGFFYGISRGRYKMMSTILNTYVALAVSSAVAIDRVAAALGIDDIFIARVIVYVAIFLILVIFLNRGRKLLFSRSISWWQIFVLSFIQTGLFIHILFSFLPPERVKLLAPLTRAFFANPSLHLGWLAAPLIFLIFFHKLGRREE